MTNDPTQNARILVVDDDEGMRSLVKIMLARAGFTVTLAIDGLDAMRKLAEQLPDVIVSDVMMPNLDGFGLLERVRANLASRDLPVILLTARSSSGDMAEGFGLGASDYLVKPVKQSELINCIQKHLVGAVISTVSVLQDM
jgi:DNA-binding response OmpR family regulator